MYVTWLDFWKRITERWVSFTEYYERFSETKVPENIRDMSIAYLVKLNIHFYLGEWAVWMPSEHCGGKLTLRTGDRFISVVASSSLPKSPEVIGILLCKETCHYLFWLVPQDLESNFTATVYVKLVYPWRNMFGPEKGSISENIHQAQS